MGIYKRGDVYWYKFMFAGTLIRESTRQGNDKIARNMEWQRHAELVKQQSEIDAVRERLKCASVLRCHQCEKLFNADKAVRKNNRTFCTTKCVSDWDRTHNMPTLEQFLNTDFIPFAETKHKAAPA